MPPAQASVTKQMIDPSRSAEYPITIGESLKRVSLSDTPTYTSVKYNYKPQSALPNTIPGKLMPTPTSSSSSPPFTLTLTPSANASQLVTYTGAQHPSKKTECVLLFNPTTQEFTLEKLDSTFTFNAKVFSKAHPPLPLEEESEDEAASPGEKDDTNPFDYRHFLNRKSEKASRAGEKAKKEERRREALRRAGKDRPEEEEEEDEEDAEGGMVLPDISRPKTGGKTIAEPESEESEEEEEEEESDEDIADAIYHQPPPPPPQPIHAPVARNKAVNRRQQEDDLEEIVLPDIPSAAQANSDDEEISDVDESDDDAPPVSRQPPPPPPAQTADEEEDEETYALMQELERELESGDDGLNLSGEMEVDTPGLVIEDDAERRPVGLGIAVPQREIISLRQMMGGGGEDESESEEE